MAIYIMSDIHGLKQRFDNMLNLIALKPEDRIYILGDVIDRGPDGIELLETFMENEQFTLILGNHELMMLDFYLDQKNKEPNIEYEERWLRNGCLPTREQYESRIPYQQEQILEYLQKCPLAISDLFVNDYVYYLVHGSPVLSLRSGNAYLDSDFLKLFSTHDFVWNRINEDTVLFDDRCVIVGHTMTSFYQDNKPYSIWSDNQDLSKAKIINIDCGCASNDANTQLACLRLDDLKVFYC